jgi:biopolymer transport protein ExbD
MNRILEVCLIALTLASNLTPAASAQSPEMRHGVSVQLATTGSATAMPEADKDDAWIVTVSADGSLYFGMDPVTPESLVDEMKRRPRNRDAQLYIKADARVPFAQVEKVLAVAHIDFFQSAVLLTSQQEASIPGTLVPPQGLEVQMSPALPAGKVATVVQLVNSGRHSPSLSINGDQIPWPALQSTLRQHFEKGDDKVILLKADGQLPFADVVRVIDASQSVGAKVVLPTPQL